MDIVLSLPEPLSVEDFLAWDAPEGAIWQLVDGTPRAMAPASPTHAVMQSEVARLLGNHLAEHRPGCTVLTNPGVIPERHKDRNYLIPDLAVTCSLVPRERPSVQDPVLVVEILSPNNQVETWVNVWAYTTIPSVREVLVVRSTTRGALLLRRMPDDAWPDTPAAIEDGALTLDSIGLTIPLADLYRGSWLGSGNAPA